MKRIILCFALICSITSLSAQNIPDFTLTDLDGNQLSLHQTLGKGQAVILDFFASWCGPCVASSAELNSFYQDNGTGLENLEVFSITIEEDDDADKINSLSWGGHYPTFAYTPENYNIYNYYGDRFNNPGSIPFFIMICPDVNDPANSQVIEFDIGYRASMFAFRYQIALNNCASATSTHEIDGLNDMSLFPNPATERLNLMISAERNLQGDIVIYNTIGQELKRINQAEVQAGTQTFEIDLSNFGAGVYMMSYQSGQGVATRKFSVSR